MKIRLNAVFLSLFLLCSFYTLPLLALEAPKNPDGWSQTVPAINLTHIFDGQINRKGKSTGFHHRLEGENTATARLTKLLSGPNKAGIYTALVNIFDKRKQVWREKFSSLFPDRFHRQRVLNAILHAYKNNVLKTARKWRGPSGFGFMVEGYQLKDGRIITAYPIYKKDE
ncbi:MAG: EndoU domain-containing protein [Sneathiella sp.]|nr:EndoU domain-containing protein [Sneathiella sp.]